MSESRAPMKQCWFRFYASLNDFLPAERKHVEFVYEFELSSSLKDAIEGLGVPHTEIDLVLVNGVPSPLTHLVRDADHISVYPWFCSVQPEAAHRLRPGLLAGARFVCDTHLGRLAAYLRMLGFDATYRNDFPDDQIACLSATEQRVLLTRDRGLLKRRTVVRGYFVRASNPREQLQEIVERYDLLDQIRLFTRCMKCNAPLQPVRKEEVLERLPPRTRQYHDEFRFCPGCGKIYWQGSHYRRMRRLIDTVIASKRAGQ